MDYATAVNDPTFHNALFRLREINNPELWEQNTGIFGNWCTKYYRPDLPTPPLRTMYDHLLRGISGIPL